MQALLRHTVLLGTHLLPWTTVNGQKLWLRLRPCCLPRTWQMKVGGRPGCTQHIVQCTAKCGAEDLTCIFCTLTSCTLAGRSTSSCFRLWCDNRLMHDAMMATITTKISIDGESFQIWHRCVGWGEAHCRGCRQIRSLLHQLHTERSSSQASTIFGCAPLAAAMLLHSTVSIMAACTAHWAHLARTSNPTIEDINSCHSFRPSNLRRVRIMIALLPHGLCTALCSQTCLCICKQHLQRSHLPISVLQGPMHLCSCLWKVQSFTLRNKKQRRNCLVHLP